MFELADITDIDELHNLTKPQSLENDLYNSYKAFEAEQNEKQPLN